MVDRIKALISIKGVSVANFCDEIGIAKNAMSEWKSGRIKPSIDAIVKIAKYFGVSTDYLLTGKEDADVNATAGPTLIIPPELEGALLAFHRGEEDLTQDDVEDIAAAVQILRERRKREKGRT